MSQIYIVLDEVIDSAGEGTVHFGVNITDRFEGWTENYRIPDVTVYLTGTTTEHSGPAFVGGPDFLTEIRSEDDRTWEKLPFYASLKVPELSIVERDPWKLTLLRLNGAAYDIVCVSTPESATVLRSEVIPLSFRMIDDPSDGLAIEIAHRDGVRRWRIVPKDERAVLIRLPSP